MLPDVNGPTDVKLEQVPLHAAMRLIATPQERVLRQRLQALGLRPGATIEVLQRTTGSGRIVAVNGSRVAIDRSVARKLEVRAAA